MSARKRWQQENRRAKREGTAALAAAYCKEIQDMLDGKQSAKEAEKNAKRKIRREK